MDIMLRFRNHECGMVFDLTKAYNSLKTGPIERHLRRFVWRFNEDHDWEDFAFDCVAFGDYPAANLLEIGRDKTADAGKDIDPTAARKIKDDSYVNDNVSGGTYEEVRRMKGSRLPDGSYSGTMRQILDLGNLRMKVIVSTGESDEEVKNILGNKVLGYHWDATSDMMGVSFPVHLDNKRGKARTTPPLSVESLGLLETTKLTKRVCLGIANGCPDFLGLACPFTLRFKLLMRQFFEGKDKDMNWETVCPTDLSDSWKELIAQAVLSDGICFPRCTRPQNAMDCPLVVGFSDGAFPAFSAVIYLQWQIPCSHGEVECDQDYKSSLLLAKAKVTPVSGYTVPRSELSGVVLESRLALTTVKALQSEQSMIPKGVVMMSDSTCSISAVDTKSRALRPFFHNRVSEILDNISAMRKYCPVEDIHYVSSGNNPADLATRGTALPSELGPESFWQLGPTFLCSRRDLWPISRDFIKSDIPDSEIRKDSTFVTCLRTLATTSNSMSSAADQMPQLWKTINGILHYSNSIKKVKNILARVTKGWRLKSQRKQITRLQLLQISRDDLLAAENLLLLSAMPETVTNIEDGKLDSLCPEKSGKIYVTTGRIGEKSLSRLLGVASLPILMPKTRAAYLYMVRAHESNEGTVHNSITEPLARSRQEVWIHRGRDLASQVCSQCPFCKRDKEKLCHQKMSQIKEESLSVCRPWTHISLDFSGPLKVKGIANSRAKMKCWIAVYCCRSTKAVELLVIPGYDTENFLLKHEEFIARHGAPESIVSDRGTQLVSAGRILANKEDDDLQSPAKWDWQKITQHNQACCWKFVPVGTPHFNGLPEAMVKVLKKSLRLSLHPGIILNYPELVTLCARISYTINSRPLGVANISSSSQQEDIMMPLTPNMLLLGRSSDCSPPMEYSANEKFSSRLSYVGQVESDWWDR